MKKTFLFFFFYVTTIFSNPLNIDVSASNAILINADNNRVLFEKNANQRVYPASITKMLVIWYVLENYSENLNKDFIASENALNVVVPEKKISSNYTLAPYVLETDGSHFDLIKGERLSLNDLLHGMMVCSGNDASNVVAESLGGSIAHFMKKINAFLKLKGISDTTLFNPHGLHYPEHKSTAYDISKAAKLALSTPKFLDIFSCKFYVRPKTNKQQKKEIITFNKLLKPGKNYYKYAIGSKTGYHSQARYNLVTVAKNKDRTLIAVVLGCSKNEMRYEDTKKMFQTAFLENKITKHILDKEKIFLAKIEGGAKILKAHLQKDVNVEMYPSEEVPLRAIISWDKIKAPIKKGQRVASLAIKTQQDELLKKVDIYAKEDVRRTFFFTLKELFKKS